MITYNHASTFHHLLFFSQSPKSMNSACYVGQFSLSQGLGLQCGGLPCEAVGGLDHLDIPVGPSGMHRVPCCKYGNAHGRWCRHCEQHSKHESLSAEC